MNKIIEFETPGWLYLVNPSAEANRIAIAREVEKQGHGTIGKYMFFSDDRGLLIKLGKKLLGKFDLFHAKVPLSETPKRSQGFGFVLCIYDVSPRFRDEFIKFADEKTIRYMHWKRDSDTMRENTQKNSKKMKNLRKVVSDDEGVLNRKTIRDIEKARKEYKEGKFYTFEEVKKKYGL